MDILLLGRQFTWSNNRENESWSRIDRFLLPPDWKKQFPYVVQRRLPILMLDHFPLLLNCGVASRRSRYFKLENVVEVRGFCGASKAWWKSYNFQGSPSYVLTCKLRGLKMDLKKWNEEIFGDVGKRKKELVDGI
jgi:hypothetical protein